MIEAVIFDFDGTIMNTNRIVMESWQYTYRELTGKEGDKNAILKTFGEPLEQSMINAFPNISSEVSVATYRGFHRDNFLNMIELFPGVENMLADVKKAGYKMGLATSRLKATTYQGLDKYNMRDTFDVIVTVEDVSKHKPDPESLIVTAEKLGAKPENSVMVGDSRFDILCGKNAGALTVLVGWSEAMPSDINAIKIEERPDFLIKSASELAGILEKL